MKTIQIFASAKSGWYCCAKFNKKKSIITWHHEEDEASDLSKKDLKIIKEALLSKKGKLFKSFKHVEMDSVVVKIIKEKSIL